MVTVINLIVYMVIGCLYMAYLTRHNILHPNDPDERGAAWFVIILWPVYLPLISCYIIGKKILERMKGFSDSHDL